MLIVMGVLTINLRRLSSTPPQGFSS